MKRIIPAIMLVTSLTGCAIPLAVTIGSAALDAILSVSTGKDTKDHLLSMAMMQDCELFRIVEGKKICIDDPKKVPSELPDDVFLQVKDASGRYHNERVVRIQPVRPIREMQSMNPGGMTVDEIIKAAPSRQAPGLTDRDLSSLPDIE